MLSAMGFKSRCGMLLNRHCGAGVVAVQGVAGLPATNVLVASSCAVSMGITWSGTVGLLPTLSAVKSPPRIFEVGILVEVTVTGAKSQRRSYEVRKKVLPLVNGTGPLKE